MSSKDILDFDFHQVMRLSNVKRWGIIEMSRQQTVAEHSYNVIAISMMMCKEIDNPDLDVLSILQWATVHDLTEVSTGDIPTPLKTVGLNVFRQLEESLFPEYSDFRSEMVRNKAVEMAIVKVADYVDAIQFAQKFCIDSRKEAVISEMVNKMNIVISQFGCINRIGKIIESWLDLRID